MTSVFLIGAKGQLGQEIQNNVPREIKLIPFNKDQFNLNYLNKCKNLLNEYKPKWVINCAAYTNVENAESDSNLAFKINSYAPKILATALEEYGGNFIQISTDFVFDGNKKSPYKPFSDTNPINIYGKSKLAGEIEVLKLKNTNVIRTSWLYGTTGTNFVLKMLELQNRYSLNGKTLKVVSDQYGCPTYTMGLSKLIFRLIYLSENNIIDKSKTPIFHWSDYGITTWYEFSLAIAKIGLKLKILKKKPEIVPVKSADYLSKCKRPKFSALECSDTIKVLGINQIDWEENLFRALNNLKNR